MEREDKITEPQKLIMSGARNSSMRYEVMKRDGFKCVICGISADNAKLQLNHLVKMIDGGQHSLDNTITVCPSCYNVREVKNVLALSSKKMQRSYHLRRKLNGVMCDTAKSTCIHEMRTPKRDGVSENLVEQLFKTRDEVLFILSFGEETGIKGLRLRVVSEREAKKWLKQDENSTNIMGLLNKQVTSNFTLRLPTPLKDELVSMAEKRGLRLHALIIEILQESIGPQLNQNQKVRAFPEVKAPQEYSNLVQQIRDTQVAQSNLIGELESLLRNMELKS